MTKVSNCYQEALDTMEVDSKEGEVLVLAGYFAGLKDATRMLNESLSVTTERGKAGRFYSVMTAKLSRHFKGYTRRILEIK